MAHGVKRNIAGWCQAVRGARKALDSCEVLIGDVRKVLRVSRRYGTARPIRALEGFDGAGSALVRASDRLGHALARLKLAASVLESNPWEGAGAPEALIRTTRRLVDLGVALYELSERLSRTSEQLIEAAKKVGHGAPLPPASRPMPSRKFLLRPPEPIILKRRERPPPPAPEDAPRRVSRGRAPPFVELPSPFTAVRQTSKRRRHDKR